MGSKEFLFLGLCLAIFAMISSEVLARELSETSITSKEDSKKSNNKYEVDEDPPTYGTTPIGGGGYPAGGGGYPDGGGGGGGYPSGGREGGRRGGGGRRYCRYGCCGRRNYNGCSRCCSYKGEAIHG